MISNKNKNLAHWAMDFALKNGCQEVKINLYSGSNSTFEIRDMQLDKLQQNSQNELTLYLYVNGRYGTYTTNRLEKKELESFILNGIASTSYLEEDKYRTLAEPSRYYKGGRPDLQLFDPTLNNVSPDTKLELALNTAAEIYNKDERIISVGSTMQDGEGSQYILTSNGFEGEKQNTWCSLSANVSIKGEGEARPSSYWYDSALYFNDLIKSGIGQKALERTLQKLGQKKISSGKYTMVVDNMVASQMLSPLIQALYGSSLQQKNSFLLDKKDTKIGSNLFTLLDEPHLTKSSGASYFDNEGVATQPRKIFEEGVLKEYFISTYYANKMGILPTISYPSILTLIPGKKSQEELIADIQKGILVTGFNGGNCNSSSGDCSYGIEGFLIENGKLTQPISEMNVTGNMRTLWASLQAVGNDPRLSSSWRIPSLVFEGINFSGL